MKMNKYKYFLMDLDGTVSDSKLGITKAVAYALDKYDIEVDDLDSLCKFIGPPLTESFQKYYNFSEEQCKEAVEKYREYYNEYGGIYENLLYEGIEQLLQKVNANGGIVILATSKPEVMAKVILEHFHLEKYFTYVAGSNLDLSRYKKGEVIAHVLSEMNIDKQDAIMIGDREHDIIGAKENGIASVGVLYGYGDRDELEEVGADYIVRDVRELENLMLTMIY